MTVLVYFIAWAVIGLMFFIIWVGGNDIDLYFEAVPRWKMWLAFILGGPIVWLLGALS